MPLGLLSRGRRTEDEKDLSPRGSQGAEGGFERSETDGKETSSSPSPTRLSPRARRKQRQRNESSNKNKSNRKMVAVVCWKEAHRETCLSQSTLCASIQQLMEEGGFTNLSDYPNVNDKRNVLLWAEPETTSAEILRRIQQQWGSTTTTLSRDADTSTTMTTPAKSTTSIFSTAVSAAGQVASIAMIPFDFLTSPLAGQPGDYDEEVVMDERLAAASPTAATARYNNENNNMEPALADDENDNDMGRVDTGAAVDQGEPILNVDLTLQCLERLRRLVHQDGSPRILVISNDDHDQPGPADTLQHWFQSLEERQHGNQQDDDMLVRLLSRLPDEQASFLMHILVAAGKAQKVDRQATLGKPDLIVFSNVTANNSDRYHASVEVQVALYDVQTAMRNLERRVQTLERDAQKALQSAVQHKRSGNQKAALYQVQRKRRLQHEMDACYGHLANLEQQQLALERAGDTQRIHQAMQQTAETLKTIRLSKQEEAQEQPTVQETGDRLAEEIQQVNQDNLTLTTAMTGMEGMDDEDELLKELESLQQQDEEMAQPAKPKASATAATAATTSKDTKQQQQPDEEDIDIDDLLEELELLSLDKPNKKGNQQTNPPDKVNNKKPVGTASSGPAIQASVFGAASGTEGTAASSSASSSNSNKPHKRGEQQPEQDGKKTTTTKSPKAFSFRKKKPANSQPAAAAARQKQTKKEPQLASAVCL